jgi:N-formylglutamate amidohydrolase
MSVLALTLPKEARTAVVVEVPHAGLAIPEPLRDEVLASFDAIRRDADLYVDELYARAPDAGAALLTAKLSRYVVDLNRAADDVDLETVADHPAPRSVQPRGVVWRVTTDGRPALRKPLDFATLKRRLDAYHVPYHRALGELVLSTRERFGYAVLVAGHSMPSAHRRGMREAERRADIVPGSLGRTTADRRVIDFVDTFFRSAGLSVRHDDPYRGGFTTGHYGRPDEGVHAIQIEINRALYMDELTFRPKSGDFEGLQRLLGELVARLGELDLS